MDFLITLLTSSYSVVSIFLSSLSLYPFPHSLIAVVVYKRMDWTIEVVCLLILKWIIKIRWDLWPFDKPLFTFYIRSCWQNTLQHWTCNGWWHGRRKRRNRRRCSSWCLALLRLPKAMKRNKVPPSCIKFEPVTFSTRNGIKLWVTIGNSLLISFILRWRKLQRSNNEEVFSVSAHEKSLTILMLFYSIPFYCPTKAAQNHFMASLPGIFWPYDDDWLANWASDDVIERETRAVALDGMASN